LEQRYNIVWKLVGLGCRLGEVSDYNPRDPNRPPEKKPASKPREITMARYSFGFRDLPSLALEFRSAGLVRGWGLYHDGKKLKRRGSSFSIPNPEGGHWTIAVKRNIDFSAPSFVYGDEVVRPRDAITWYLIALAAVIPIVVGVGVGGSIGAALAGGLFIGNLILSLSERPLGIRVRVVAGVSVVALAFYSLNFEKFFLTIANVILVSL
jgi:hypothetical protein